MPAGIRLVPDRDLAILADGQALVGGNPVRLVRLRPRGADMVGRWLGGAPVGNSRAERVVARRLVRAGLLHPRPQPVPPGVLVTVVVPVRDRPELLQRLLTSLRPLSCVVVDDASIHRAAVEKVAREAGAEYIRLATRVGPAGARNAGLARVESPFVAFADSDCTVPPGWLEPLLGHFVDPAVALVAPRVVTRHGSSWLERYESARSPLDLGDHEGPVGPGRAVAYVPSAAIVLRRAATPQPCFDPELRVGEDVDLVWRLVEAGWEVRYVPEVEVEHHRPLGPATWAARRAAYGSSAGALAVRHRDAAAPVRLSPAAAAGWGLLASGRPGAALGVLAASSTALGVRLNGVVDRPFVLAARLSANGIARSAVPTVAGLARAWGPALATALFVRRLGRARVVLAVTLGVGVARGWRTRPPELDPARYLALRLADDLAYGAGVWWGALQARTLRPLLPAVVTRRGTAWARGR